LGNDPQLPKLAAAVYMGEKARAVLESVEVELLQEQLEELQVKIQHGEEAKVKIQTYVDTLLTATNPRENAGHPQTAGVLSPHPCSINVLDIFDSCQSMNEHYEQVSLHVLFVLFIYSTDAYTHSLVILGVKLRSEACMSA
jgi:hypothetical protein